MSKSVKNKKVLRYVKINPGRGYGSGLFAVVDTSDKDHYTLLDKDGAPFQLYRAHCYGDADTARANVRLNQEKAVKNQ